ncbi:hypothetical protein C8R46DRAFT_942901 [Mycena filopes]|nr:hypothetical protein C8R46DRAFT_942901 [Mycena filopes]
MTSQLPSPFASKLGTNYCPSDAEVLDIQRLLLAPLSRLKHLNDRIAELQKAIDQSSQERDSVSTHVETQRALLSPLRRLPSEIGQEIFMACLPTRRNCVMSAAEAPVLLGRICSSWRAISLATPRLWSRLHIAEPGRMTPLAKRTQRLATASAWLGRSGQCPLSISLEGSDGHILPGHPIPGARPDVNCFLQLILRHITRCEHITVAAPSWMLDALLDIPEKDVPMLQSLDIRNLKLGPTRRKLTYGLFRAPKLSAFALTTRSDPVAFPLLWENLTSLCLMNRGQDVTPIRSALALQILSKCTRLQACSLRVTDPHNAVALEETVLELPHLHALDIVCVGSTIFSPGRIFSRLSLPELRSLTVTSLGVQTSSPVELSFPFHASPQLERLHLELQLFSRRSLLHLLSVLPPTIRQLLFAGDGHPRRHGFTTAHGGPFGNEALAVLTPSPDNPAPSCPILEDLELDSRGGFSDYALLQFVKARMMAVPAPTLRRVAVQFKREKEFDIRPEIQSFLDAGLEVSIRYIQPPIIGLSPWQGLAEGSI